MSDINLTVTGHDIDCTAEAIKIKIDLSSYNRVNITADSSWDGYDLKAVFCQDFDNEIPVCVDLQNGSCGIPESALNHPGKLYIGLRGTGTDGRIGTSAIYSFEVTE